MTGLSSPDIGRARPASSAFRRVVRAPHEAHEGFMKYRENGNCKLIDNVSVEDGARLRAKGGPKRSFLQTERRTTSFSGMWRGAMHLMPRPKNIQLPLLLPLTAPCAS